MAKTRQKTMSYRRAGWFTADGKDRNLENLVRDAHKKLKTVASRKFRRADGQFLKGVNLKPSKNGGYFIHIAAETPGDHASILARGDESKSISNVNTAPPPKGNEYMDGDILVYVNNNDVCLCSSVLRDGAVTTFLREMFIKAKLGDDATKFDLMKVASVDKVKLIKSQGVKEVCLRASLYDATTSYIDRKDTPGALGTLGRHFSAILKRDKKPKKDNLSVFISIAADGRVRDHELGDKSMQALAKDIVDSDEDYIIITKKNQRITGDEILVRQAVNIDRVGKSVDRDRAWSFLEGYYKQLKSDGVTAQ